MSYYQKNNLHDINTKYVKKIRDMPMLTTEEEYTLAQQWRDNQDEQAVQKLVESHLRLVMKIASGYRGYGLPLNDLISEGHIGIMHALKNYDPEKGFRLSTYAAWWVRAAIQEYILHTWSLVKIGTTAAQKKLFFRLRREKAMMEALSREDQISLRDQTKELAKKFDVSEQDIEEMTSRLSGNDYSLNAPLSHKGEGESEWQDWISDETPNQETALLQADEFEKRQTLLKEAMKCLNKREHDILVRRRLSDNPPTLERLSSELGLSRERVRQIEMMAFSKLQKEVLRLQGG